MGVEIKESVISDTELEDMKHLILDYLSVSVENKDDGRRMRWYPWHSAECRFNHILNAVDLTTHIADRKGTDVSVAHVAAFFYDVPKLEVGQEVRAEEGACVARESLSNHGDCPDSFIDQVRQVVPGHSYQGPLTDVSLRTHCLIEANILDKIGASGTALMLLRMGREARTHMDAVEMVEYIFKYDCDVSDRLETDAAQSFVHQRLKHVGWFREWLEEEIPEMDHDGQLNG